MSARTAPVPRRRAEATSYPDVVFARRMLVTQTELDRTTGCLLWQGARNRAGYPYVRFKGVMVGAHRVVYKALLGPLAPREPVHHVCARRACINPEHLQRASVAENSLEALGRAGLTQRIAWLEDLMADAAMDAAVEHAEREATLLERIDHLTSQRDALRAVLAEVAPHHPMARKEAA